MNTWEQNSNITETDKKIRSREGLTTVIVASCYVSIKLKKINCACAVVDPYLGVIS